MYIADFSLMKSHWCFYFDTVSAELVFQAFRAVTALTLLDPAQGADEVAVLFAVGLIRMGKPAEFCQTDYDVHKHSGSSFVLSKETKSSEMVVPQEFSLYNAITKTGRSISAVHMHGVHVGRVRFPPARQKLCFWEFLVIVTPVFVLTQRGFSWTR